MADHSATNMAACSVDSIAPIHGNAIPITASMDDGSSDDFNLSISPEKEKKIVTGQRRAGRSSSAGTKRGQTSSEPGRPPRGMAGGKPESP